MSRPPRDLRCVICPKSDGDGDETTRPYSGRMMPITRMHAVISGTVQGVGFRYWTARKADGLRLGGYARNRFDGTVEVEAEGPEDAVDELMELLWSGPPTATVTGVDIRTVEPHGDDEAFNILH